MFSDMVTGEGLSLQPSSNVEMCNTSLETPIACPYTLPPIMKLANCGGTKGVRSIKGVERAKDTSSEGSMVY